MRLSRLLITARELRIFEQPFITKVDVTKNDSFLGHKITDFVESVSMGH
jgi:hypothetical protein